MNIRELAGEWEEHAAGTQPVMSVTVRLDLEAAARLAALCEMYPRRNAGELLSELVSAALHELEASFPYVQGTQVVATDEQGDPLYADAGPTPRFLALARKHRDQLAQRSHPAKQQES